MTRVREDQLVEKTSTSPKEREQLAVSVPQAAIMLGISRALAYELVARGDLPSLRLGRRLVVPRRALVELVETTA